MKQHKPISTVLIVLGVLTLSGADSAFAAGRKPTVNEAVPDFTQGGKPDENHDWQLGPTGARGWIHGWKGRTAEARQILVTMVAKGSPADGMLRSGDVVLGVGDGPFAGDARIEFGRAITAAEEDSAGGILRLVVWRGGQTRNVQLKLAVLGAYSATAPYDCPKSRQIFERGCRYIARKGLAGVSIPNDLNALALLASGFAKMSAAAYAERERGHTGNFFNILWALPGVSRCGALATGAYWKEQSWYYDLARDWQGGFSYQGSPAGEEEHNKYTDWDCTGAYLLAYGLPLKSLYLTGKKPCSAPALDRPEVDDVIAAGRDYSTATKDTCYDGRTAAQLLAGLSSWSPAVRKRSAQALGRREGDFVPLLVKQLAGSNRDARYGACEALGCLGARADAAAAQLRATLNDPDPWLQSLSCISLASLGPEARKASVSDILRMTVQSNPGDPRRMAQRFACMALFSPYPGSREPKSMLAESLEGVDRKLLYPAIESVLANEDAAARGSLQRVYGELSDHDLVELLPAIVKAIEQLAPSNEMFGDGIRLAGLDLVSRFHIREGMPLCVSVMEVGRWGAGKRVPKCLEYLGRYGVHAKEVLPRLREIRRGLVQSERPKQPSENVELLDKAIAAITASTASPTLVDLKEFRSRP